MKVIPQSIPEVLLVELDVHRDSRGFFVERYQLAKFTDLRLPTQFVQDNHSRSAPGILRGLHFQVDPSQGKLVGVTRGRIWDVAVDLRADSATFGKHCATELSDENGRLLWIPPGFAHGFCVLGNESADVLYKIDALYNPKTEIGVHWADPDLGIPWPISNPLVSPRDEKLPSYRDYVLHPPQWSSR